MSLSHPLPAGRSQRPRQLFVVDPVARLRPAKDSSVALMQAAQRAGLSLWWCTPADLIAAGAQVSAWARPLRLAWLPGATLAR